MTDRPAKLAYLTSPARGETYLHVLEDEAGPLHSFRISRDQLLRLNAETADILVKEFK